MPMDTVHAPTIARSFALGLIAWWLGLFALLRLPWVGAHLLLPVTQLQAAAGSALARSFVAAGRSDARVQRRRRAGPVPWRASWPIRRTWRTRLAGAGGGVAVILVVNTLRIGTLGRVVASQAWFNALHLYVWPALLTLAIAGYVLAWMRLADRPRAVGFREVAAREPLLIGRPHSSRRFVVLTGVLLILFVAASPFYLGSPSVLALATFIARAAALTLATAGVSAHATANVLWVPQGGFLVTEECVSTPLIPVYLAAVCTYATTRRRLILGVLATLPLFVILGILRVLVVALPVTAASPTFVVHAFFQLLLGAVLVFIVARWRHGGRAALRHALAGVVVGVLFVQLLGPWYTRVVTPQIGTLDDPQGAIALLPAFQVGLYLALWVAAFVATGWRRFFAGLAVLGLTQTASLLALQALAIDFGLTAHVRDVRGWAVAGPVLVVAAVVNVARARR